MSDSMTPIERFKALEKGQAVDRLPITFSHESFAAKLIGLNYRQGFNTAENAAKKEINLYQKYGIDGISVAYTSVNFGIRFRSKIKSPKDSPASVVEHRLDSIEAIDELDLSVLDFKRDISQQVNYGAIEIMLDQVGDEINPTYSISAPFTMASGVLPAEKLLRAMRKHPDKVHQLMRFITQAIKTILEPVQSFSTLSYFIYDPVASGSLISPKQYEEFCLPYTKEIVNFIKKKNPHTWVGMHICGDTTRSLELIASTGIDGFSLDQKVDLAVASEKVGDQLTLLGNVDPIRVFLQGTPDLMEDAVKDNYTKAYHNPKGFIIRSGCAVPYETPVEMVDAYVDSAKKYGQWPYQAELFT